MVVFYSKDVELQLDYAWYDTSNPTNPQPFPTGTNGINPDGISISFENDAAIKITVPSIPGYVAKVYRRKTGTGM